MTVPARLLLATPLVALACNKQPDPPAPAVDLSTGPTTKTEGESYLVLAPDGQRMVAAWMGEESGADSPFELVFHIDYRVSLDRGATWSEIQRAEMSDAVDPTFAFDGAGRLHLAFLSRGSGIFVARANANGTFESPAPISESQPDTDWDKPWIARTPGGALLVTYMQEDLASAAPHLVRARHLVAARSADGVTWTRADFATGPVESNPWTHTCSAQGRVWAVHMIGGAVELRWSDDDGATWPVANTTTVSLPEQRVAFNPVTCVAEGREVWVSYGLTADPFLDVMTFAFNRLDAIVVAHSSDGGGSIDRRYDAHDPEAGRYQFLPQLVLGAGGAVHALYYTGDDADRTGTFRRAKLARGAPGFARSVAVSAPMTFEVNWGSKRWLGDYFGTAFGGDTLFVTYNDNTRGTNHIVFQAIGDP